MSFENMSWDQVCRRAGGRRHYNAWRQERAYLRRGEVARLLLEAGAWLRPRGTQAWIARQLGVSEATISRDIKRIRRDEADRYDDPDVVLRRAARTMGLIEPSPAAAHAQKLMDEWKADHGVQTGNISVQASCEALLIAAEEQRQGCTALLEETSP